MSSFSLDAVFPGWVPPGNEWWLIRMALSTEVKTHFRNRIPIMEETNHSSYATSFSLVYTMVY